MKNIKVTQDVAIRLSEFIASDWYSKSNAHAKSEYWDYHADQISAHIGGNAVGVAGKSGFYVPENASSLNRALQKVLRAFSDPGNSAAKVRSVMREKFGVPRLMSYKNAFDATMSSDEQSEPILSPYRIDHRRLQGVTGVFPSSEAVARHYTSWSGYDASDSIYYHYYYSNLLRHFTGGSRIHTIMEIGAGNGNFPSIFFRDWAPVRIVLVDLPETLTVAIPFLSNLFPQAKLLLPQEVPPRGLADDFDFAFLTVDQLNMIPDSTVDLAINCHSFQEMTRDQIAIYFQLVQRVTCEGGFFFAANRVEKIPCGPNAYSVEQTDPPNRFAEYPWHLQNDVLVYEISRLSRLAQLDDVYLRLDRIRK